MQNKIKDATALKNPTRQRGGPGFAAGILCAVLVLAGCSSTRNVPDEALLAQAWNTIESEYVNAADVKRRQLVYGAISGMVDALGDDGHSTFLTPAMVRDLEDRARGELKGIGIEIQVRNGRIVVVAPLDGSPAQRAGIKPGVIIEKINEEDISDWPLSRAAEKISGPAGTSVRLTLLDPRTGIERQLTLMRASIRMHYVTWRRLPGTTVAHVRLASFDEGVTAELRKALVEIEQQKLEGVILDLRNNPGGYLEEGVGVASQFLEGGNVLLAKDARNRIASVKVRPGGVATNLNLVVLINAGTASAAEIVAGALHDANRAPLVGETSFGTGTVLTLFRLADGSGLLLAVEEWLTPAGNSFWHKGIQPDVAVNLAPEAELLLPHNEDELSPAEMLQTQDQQLLRALALVENPALLRASLPAGTAAGAKSAQSTESSPNRSRRY